MIQSKRRSIIPIYPLGGGGDVGELKSRKITVRDSNHVHVESKYENYVYGVLLTVVKDGSAFKIDSLQKEKSEYVNAN